MNNSLPYWSAVCTYDPIILNWECFFSRMGDNLRLPLGLSVACEVAEVGEGGGDVAMLGGDVCIKYGDNGPTEL